MKNEELLKLAYTRELTDERVRVAAAYWLDASPHERTEADGVILARYARHAMNRIEVLEREKEEADSSHMETASMVAGLMVENTTMKKALDWYADSKNNDWAVDGFDEVIPSQVMIDGGQCARDVLASLSQPPRPTTGEMIADHDKKLGKVLGEIKGAGE